MKKTLFIIQFMAVLVFADSVIIGEETCTCEQLMLKADCISNPNCQWKSDDINLCILKSPPSALSSFAKYCQSFQQSPLTCAQKEGCAYFDNKCLQFPGCSAYGQTTTAECQAISNQCISNGKECAQIQECPEYQTKIICESSPSKSGRKLCIWENDLCREEKCTDAAFITDIQCDQWMKGCISTGKQCIDVLGYCSSYQGDNQTCETFIGLDGKCEGGIEVSDCKAKACVNAPATYKSDKECQTYQIGCVTNGKGCTNPPLQQCQFYEIKECIGYIGINGLCQVNTEGTLCIPQPCEEASIEYKTDEECKQFRIDCVTTGKGCISKRSSCSSYNGTVESCQGYIGSDGYCKGSNSEISACTPKLCQDAPQTYSTNEECNLFQIGCVTNGKGCSNSLYPCSIYAGTTATCEGFIGSDGKCKGISSESISMCVPKKCIDAPINYATNEECNSYQFGCVTNGKGCIEQKQCKNTATELSCIGTHNCQQNWICVNSSNCIDFKSASVCNNNLAGKGDDARKCYWTENSCRDLLCSDAPKEYTTDGQCAGFRKDCLAKGKGCISNQEPCSSYYGTQQTCAQYTIGCWNISDATDDMACTERQCSDITIAKSDNECEQFKSECRFNGQSCIDQQLPCNSYQGEQVVCSSFKGNNGNTNCWNISTATNTTPCINKECSQNTDATTDIECIEFLEDCVTNGQGCLLKSEPCSSYSGTLEQCSSFFGTNGTQFCWLIGSMGQCIEKQCFHAPTTLTTDNDCNNFMIGCLTNGSGCVSKYDPCSSYTGTIEECSSFIGNEEFCYSDDPCADRECSDVIDPIGNNDCLSYHSDCRYLQGQCIKSRLCSEYQGGSVKECEYLTDNTPIQRKCWWTQGLTCIDRICENAPNTVSNQSECENHLIGCLYNGNNQCITRSSCSLYSAYGASDFDKLANCKLMLNIFGDQCWYSAGDVACSDKTCANAPRPIVNQQACDQHKINCTFNGIYCLSQGTCNSYIVEGTDEEKHNLCRQMKDLNNRQCYWNYGSNCSDDECSSFQERTRIKACQIRKCSGNLGAKSKSECQNWLNGCQYIGTAAMYPCIEMKSTCEMIQFQGTNLTISEISKICEDMETEVSLCEINEYEKSCRARTCLGGNQMHSREDCNNWLSGCQWDGVTNCVEPSLNCPYFTTAQSTSILKQLFCESFLTIGGKRCQVNSPELSCEDRTCEGAIKMNSQQDCHNWLANCQWDGIPESGCVEQQASCYGLNFPIIINQDVHRQQFCESYIANNSERCQIKSDMSGCEQRSCTRAMFMYSTQDCNRWKPNCQWNGNHSCIDQVPECSIVLLHISKPLDASKVSNACNNHVTATQSMKCEFYYEQCFVRQCAQAAQMFSHDECKIWQSNCLWDGTSSCVNQTEYCPTINSKYQTEVQKAKLCLNYVTRNQIKCQLSIDQSKCEERTCTGAVNMASIGNIDNPAQCQIWKSDCQWDGLTGCIDQYDYCPQPNQNTDAQRENFCLNYVPKGRKMCQYNYQSKLCELRTCAGVSFAYSPSNCQSWKSDCQWDGRQSCIDSIPYCPSTFPQSTLPNASRAVFCEQYFAFNLRCQMKVDNTGCENRSCSGATNISAFYQCNSWLQNCQWDGYNSCVDQLAECPQFLPTSFQVLFDLERLDQFCLRYFTSTGNKCQMKNDYTGCEQRTCNGAMPINSFYSSYNCSVWLVNCQWDGVSSCVDQEASCPTLFPSQTSSFSQKEVFCENYVSSSGIRCQVKSDYTGCEQRTCNGAMPINSFHSSSYCNAWLVNCQWDGVSSCVDQEASCPTLFPSQTSSFSQKEGFCENYVSSSGIRCKVKSDYTGCEQRTCNGAMPINSFYSSYNCFVWLVNCQWDGVSSCVDQEASCPTLFPSQTSSFSQKEVFCENYVSSSGIRCQVKSDYTGCEQRTCNGAMPINSFYSSYNCNAWLVNCQWDGVSSCVDQEASCPTFFPSQTSSFSQKEAFCENYVSSSWIRCQLKSDLSACEERTCQGASYLYSNSECLNWKNDCVWDTAFSCIDRLSQCPSLLPIQADTISKKTNFCIDYLTYSGVKCQLTIDLIGCEIRTCKGASNMYQTKYCNNWKQNCQWDGVSSCVDQSDTCPTSIPSQALLVQNKRAFCEMNQVRNSQMKCQLRADQSACENRTCTGAQGVNSTYDCYVWKANCQWDGSSSCVDQTTGCSGIDLTNIINKHIFCQMFITSASSRCQLKSDESGCEDRISTGQQGSCPENFPIQINTDQQSQFCDYQATSLGERCQVKQDKSGCEVRVCSGMIGAQSAQDCQNWKLNCQWDGINNGSCVDQIQQCPRQADIPIQTNTIEYRRNFCESYKNINKDRCQLTLDNLECETRTCAGAVLMNYSYSDCYNWLVNCEWDGLKSCVDCQDESQQRPCRCAYGMNSTQDCNYWKSTCQWDGNSSCGDQQLYCSGIEFTSATQTILQKQLLCESYITKAGIKCQLHPSSTHCEDRICFGASGMNSQEDCDNWLYGCKWYGIPNSDCCPSNSDQWLGSWRGSCGCATGMSSLSDCYNWNYQCQWDGVENSGCVQQTLNCPTIPTLPKYINILNKKQFCESFITTAQGRCQLSNDQTYCENRTCAGSTDMHSELDCYKWKSDCRWDGINCIDQPEICVGSCIKRQCSHAVGMNSRQDCENWQSSCQWDGKENSSCVDQVADCYRAIDISFAQSYSQSEKKSLCDSYLAANNLRCQLRADNTACEDRTCYGASNINSQEGCEEWLPHCQWIGFQNEDGRNCIDQPSVCPPQLFQTNIQRKIFCESITPIIGICQLSQTTGQCEDRTCQGASGIYSSNDCNLWLANCQWDGVDSCEPQASSCPNDISKQSNLIEKQNYCNNYQTISGGKCQLKFDETVCESRACNGKNNAQNQIDCLTWMSTCRYMGASVCIDSTDCDLYNQPQSVNLKYICESLSDTNSNPCQMKEGSCNGRTCYNSGIVESNADCENWLTGCVYIGSGCSSIGLCTSYLINGDNNDTKRSICNNLVSSTGQQCTYIDGNVNCVDRSCSNREPKPLNKETCEEWLKSCIWDGVQCLQSGQCLSYLALGANDNQKQIYCFNLVDNSLFRQQCTYNYLESVIYCVQRTCSNIPFIPNTNSDCMNYLSSCRISFTRPFRSCISRESECSAYYGSPDQCKTIIGANDAKPCWSISQVDSNCITRTCTHNTTATSNSECHQFMVGCKSNGRGCISNNISCSDQMGGEYTCPLRKASDGTNYCKVGQKTVKKCRTKSCSDDVKSTTDEQCRKFLTSCVTKGEGCISKLEPCSSYRGTQQSCSQFIGTNGAIKCWNNPEAAITEPCRERLCSDDKESETNEYCQDFLQGCVTKGKGCIDIKDPCSAYVGNQEICSQFKGLNGTKPCWSMEKYITSACRNKECEYNTTATTDSDCDAYIQRVSGSQIPVCVTNGKGCVTYPKKCQDFIGTPQQCEQFTAIDGPCKSKVIRGSSNCIQKLCQDAPNALQTDLQCKEYHPSCATNGYGCVLSSQQQNCQDIQSRSACQEKSNCRWVSDCQKIESDCVSLTSQGASVCVNTAVQSGLKKCSWRNNQCLQQSCLDLPDELISHEACQVRMSTCTTKGIGCIEMGPCSTYLTESICQSAYTTNPGRTCIWQNDKCRAKQCSDATGVTSNDSGCETFLVGCKTNGIQCIQGGLDCSSLITELICVKDSYDRPCLWSQGICQNYSKCDDIQHSTHEECQEFSTQCTTDGNKCIAIASCVNTRLQVSCKLGRDGKCGWLPAKGEMSGRCQKFKECNEAVYELTSECQQYSEDCVSDGQSCIVKSSCQSYKTQIACESGGTDGVCIFKLDQCQIRTCMDADQQNAQAINTHEGCYQFSANEKCTTNGTSCIPFGQCDSYGNEIGCQIGTDGLCIWNEEKCRLKNCTDFQFKTNEECQAVSIIELCISDGFTCIQKTYCAKYNSREACRGGGIDGICVFIPTSTNEPNAGRCKLMTQCKDASIDEETCKAKSDVCYWNQQPQGSLIMSSCDPHTCSSIAIGTICKPIPDFEKTTYEICILQNGQCVEGERSQLSIQNCYNDSMRTYMWNTANNECTACFKNNAPEVTPLDAESMEEHQLLVMILCILYLN